MLTWLCIKPFFLRKVNSDRSQKCKEKDSIHSLYPMEEKRIFKGKLNYMKKNVKAEKQFSLNKHVSKRVKL